jgi:hypothetical protein
MEFKEFADAPLPPSLPLIPLLPPVDWLAEVLDADLAVEAVIESVSLSPRRTVISGAVSTVAEAGFEVLGFVEPAFVNAVSAVAALAAALDAAANDLFALLAAVFKLASPGFALAAAAAAKATAFAFVSAAAVDLALAWAVANEGVVAVPVWVPPAAAAPL